MIVRTSPLLFVGTLLLESLCFAGDPPSQGSLDRIERLNGMLVFDYQLPEPLGEGRFRYDVDAERNDAPRALYLSIEGDAPNVLLHDEQNTAAFNCCQLPEGEDLNFLSDFCSLERLDVSSLHLTTAVLREIGRSKRLKYLKFAFCRFDEGALAPLRAHPTLQYLRLHRCQFRKGELARLKDTSISRLDLSASAVDSSYLGELSVLRKLEEIDLSQTQVADLSRLATVKSLKKISAMRLELDRDSLDGLADLPLLEELHLWGAHVKSDFSAFAGHSALRRLDVSSTRVADSDLIAISRIRSLRELVLNGCDVTEDGIAHLEPLQGLTSLSLGRIQLTDSGVKNISKLPSLVEIHIPGTPAPPPPGANDDIFDVADRLVYEPPPGVSADVLKQMLKTLAKLEVLNLRGRAEITDEHVGALVEGTKLKRLIIAETSISREGTRELRDLLSGCTIVAELDE